METEDPGLPIHSEAIIQNLRDGKLIQINSSQWTLEYVDRAWAQEDASGTTAAFAWPPDHPPKRRFTTTTRRYRTVTIDGHLREARIDGTRATVLEALEAVASAGAEYLVIHCHAEGGHADLGDSVLCGLTDEFELDARGERIQGGCVRGKSCKRIRAVTTVTYFDALAADHLILLGCNTLSAPGSFYSRSPHLTSAALAQSYHSVTLIAGLLEAPLGLVEWIARCVDRGIHPARVAHEINGIQGREGRYAAATFVDAQLSESGLLTNESGDSIAIPDRLTNANVLALGNGEGNLYISARTRRFAILNRPVSRQCSLTDISEAVEQDREWLLSAVPKMDIVNHVERSLATALRSDLDSNHEVRGALQRLASARVALDTAIADSIHEHGLTVSRGARTGHYVRALTRVNETWDRWAEALTSLHPQPVSAELLFHSLHRSHLPVNHVSEERCERCGTAVMRTDYAPWRYEHDTRIAIVCPTCGPQVESPRSTEYANPFGFDPERVVLPPAPIGRRFGGRRYVVVAIQDETTGSAYTHERFDVLALDSFNEAIPGLPDSPELHTVSVFVVQGPDLAVYMKRFPNVIR